MAPEAFTENDVRALLLAVGAAPSIDVTQYSLSFEELELDSLARVEIASRIKDRFGVDIEDELVPELTPADMRRLVSDRLTGATSGGGGS